MSTGQMATPHDQASWQAWNTLRWLEASGPRYRDVVAGFISVRAGAVRVILDGQDVDIPDSAMSHASWAICCCATTGEAVELRLRTK